ncbi:PAS domain S-box protein [Methanofollis formosanus]|uniref:PAS domain S-box protein n=1 Tax=Methanofollis formosanus TaxID=299308 RepID=A0A8G1A286_9EURY|nr:PAS domain S-box protein [Methanofollis formosanus]QYZ80029.1 PAS domain S-box protein [Methanofollis formosanus]
MTNQHNQIVSGREETSGEKGRTTGQFPENEYLLLLDAMPVQAWTLPDPETYGAVNMARAAYLGLQKDDLERRPVRDVLPEEEAAICIQGNEEVFRERRAVRTEEWILNAHGEERLLAITKKPVLDEVGTVVFAVCTAEDITEQRRAEEAVLRRDAILEAVGFAADRLLKKRRWNEEVPAILRCLGEATGASRVRLLERGGTAGEEAHPGCREWTAAGVAPLGERFVDRTGIFSAEETPQWYADLAAGRPVAAAAAAFPAEGRRHLAAEGILSLVEIPVLVDGEWWGCLGLDDCREERGWSGAEVDALRTAAGILGAAVQRRRTEDLFRLPVMYSSSGIYLAQDGTFRDVNPGFSTLFGYTREEAVGRMRQTGVILAEDRPRLEKTVHGLLSGEIDTARDHLRAVRKDGRELCLEHVGTRTLYQGRQAVVGTFIDRTAEKKAEAALRESETKYREFFNNVNDAIFLIEVTPDYHLGRFIEVNAVGCDRLEYFRRELLMMGPAGIEDWKARPRYVEIMEALILHGRATFESVFLRKDGSPMPVEVNCHLFEMAEKPVVLAVARDITERKERQKMEAEAFGQIEKNMEQFAILNDHIRNPLQVILGLACLYDEEVGGRIAGEVRKIDALVNSLDQGWLQSEKIRKVLRRHYGLFQSGRDEERAG